MPTIRNRTQQPSPVAPQVELPSNFPAVPQEIVDRFPSAAQWQRQIDEFWDRANAALQESQQQSAAFANSRVVFSVDQFLIYAKNGIPQPMFALDSTGVKLGNVLVVSTPGRKVFIGVGEFQNDNTPFYVDALGRFSLGSSLSWDPETDTLTIVGVINATSGTIGGFEIGTEYIRDQADSFGLSSNVTVADDVRFWAGASFAFRNSAPLRIFESGYMAITNLTVGNTVYSPQFLLTVSGVVTGGALISQPPTGLYNFPVVEAGVNGQNLYASSLIGRMSPQGFTGLSGFLLAVGPSFADGSGTVDNMYGIYIDTIDIGTVSNWGLYVATTAKNYMAGALQVAGLSGVGTRNVVVDAAGNLSAP